MLTVPIRAQDEPAPGGAGQPPVGTFRELELSSPDRLPEQVDWPQRWLGPRGTRPRLFGRGRIDRDAGNDGTQGRERLSDEDFLNPEEKTQFGAQQGGNRGQPDIFGRFLDPIDPARLQFALDRLIGFNIWKVSDLPKPPEISEPLYYDLMRPLGALKYDNETNYFLGSFTGKNPTLQLIELEAVIADWRAVELQMNFNNGVFVAAVPGYQRTLGVGPSGS